ncbi:MAG: nitroreductase [Halieaceae bacterium]|jgi:nitroreductase|nr:nitroreductase [Halieaceae bacterium]
MAELSVTDAMLQRGSVRAYTDQPVPADLVNEILELASHAPSGGNVQPWKIYAVTGAVKDQLSQAVLAKAAESPSGDKPDIPVYPNGLSEPWRSRRYACGELMYTALEIGREDKMGRFEQAAKNMVFFGAPVGLIITMDRALCESQMIDIGIFIQSLLLLAQERGLASCPQTSWSMWSGVIRETMDIPENEMVLIGIALGYAAAEAPINHLNQARAQLSDFADLRGF